MPPERNIDKGLNVDALKQAMDAVTSGVRFQDAAKQAGVEVGSDDYQTLFDFARKQFSESRPGIKSFPVSAKAPEVDDDEPGHVVAVFSTFNIVDRDGDVILPGAVNEEKGVPFTWAHNWSQPPLGKGDIHIDPDRAVWDGHLWVDEDPDAKRAFHAIKNMGDRQEYSWSFFVKESDIVEDEDQPFGFKREIKKTEPIEVCGAIKGINPQTYTLSAKSEPQINLTIDGQMLQAALLDVLGNTTTTTTEPPTDDEPDKKSGSRLEDQIREAQALITDLVERVSSLAETRAQEGRTISKANLDLLADLAGELEKAQPVLAELCASKEDGPDPRRQEILELFRESTELLHGVSQ